MAEKSFPILGAFMVPHPPIILPEVGHGEEITQRLYLNRGVAHLMDNIFLELVVVVAGVALVAHLRRDLVFRGGLHEKFALLERVGEGLFGEDGKPALHGGHEGGEVRVVGRHHRDGVDLAVHLVEHLAEVGEARRVGILLQRGAALLAFEIGVAEGGDRAEAGLLEFLDVVPRLVAYADAREADLAVTEPFGER